jgi:PAS domain S-box-containing protein
MNKHELENRIKVLETELIEEKRQIQFLMEGETKLQSISNNITAHIAYINADTLKYEFVNSLFEKSFGIPRNKIIGSHIKDVIGEKNYEFALKYIKEAKSGKTVSYENTFDIASGKRWSQVNYSPVIDDNHKVVRIVVVAYDITERKQVEEALLQNNNSLNMLNRFALELSNLSSNDNLEAFIAKQVKEITGAKLTVFTEYNSADRTITAKHIEAESGLLKKVLNLLGTKVQNIHSVISEEMYREMTNELIGVRGTLYEMSFGAIPRPVAAAIQTLLKVDRFIGLAYVLEGKLYGTSLLAMGKGQADLPKEILENVIHLASVSLRRKQTEKTLLESEERFQLLFNRAPLGYQSLDSDGNFMEVNQTWLDILGYTLDEVIGKWFGDFLSPEYQDSFRESFPIFKAEGKNHSELEMVHKNGNKLIIACKGNIGYDTNREFKQTHCILQDITESKQAKEALFNSEEYLRRIISSSNDCIKVLDLEGNLLSMSTGGQKLLEIEDVTLYLNRSWVDFWTGKDKEGALEAISNAKKGDTGIFIGYSPTEKGTPKWWEVIISSINDSHGNIYRLLAISRDITVRRQEEEELEKHREHLEELVRERTVELEEKNETLEKFNNLFVGREFRIKELRTEVEELKNKLSEK